MISRSVSYASKEECISGYLYIRSIRWYSQTPGRHHRIAISAHKTKPASPGRTAASHVGIILISPPPPPPPPPLRLKPAFDCPTTSGTLWRTLLCDTPAIPIRRLSATSCAALVLRGSRGDLPILLGLASTLRFHALRRWRRRRPHCRRLTLRELRIEILDKPRLLEVVACLAFVFLVIRGKYAVFVVLTLLFVAYKVDHVSGIGIRPILFLAPSSPGTVGGSLSPSSGTACCSASPCRVVCGVSEATAPRCR